MEPYIANALCDDHATLVRTACYRSITADARSKKGMSFWITNMMPTHRGTTKAIALRGHRLDGETGVQLLEAIQISLRTTGVEEKEWCNCCTIAAVFDGAKALLSTCGGLLREKLLDIYILYSAMHRIARVDTYVLKLEKKKKKKKKKLPVTSGMHRRPSVRRSV